MEYVPLYLKGVLALFIIFVLPGLLIVRMVKIDELPQRWLAVFLSSITVNHLAVTFIALLGARPTYFYAVMVLCLVVALIILELRKPKFSSAASEIRLSDVFWLFFSFIVLAATYFEVWRYGIPTAFDDTDVSISWNGWALSWATGHFAASGGYPQFVPTIWAVAYVVTGSQVQYFAFYCYLILIVAPLALNAVVLARPRWWLPLVQFSVFVCFMTGIAPGLRSTLPAAYPDWIVLAFSFAGAAAFLSQEPPHQRSFTILLLALGLECVAAATKPVLGLFVIAFALAICVDAIRHAEDRALRLKVILAVFGLMLLFVMSYWINLANLERYGLPYSTWRPAQAWQLFNSTFSLPVRVLCFSGLFLSLVLPRARWLALPLFLSIWIWVDRTGYDARNIMAIILIAALIPVDALARRYAVGDGAFGSKWMLRDTTVAACVLVGLLLLTLPIAKTDDKLEAQFAAEQSRRGPGTVHNEAIASYLRAGCTLFTTTKYPYTVVPLFPYKAQLRPFYYTLPIGDDSSASEFVRQYAIDMQRSFENVQGCAAVIFPPALAHPKAVAFLHDYFQRHNFTKAVEANGMELWSSN
jgi:hypothetical protein